MKFFVAKSSCWSGETKPCEEAYLDSFIKVDVRSCDDPAKLNRFNGDKERAEKYWYAEGRNHRVENGNIKRDFEGTGWFIDINSLEELLHFKNRVNHPLIIDNAYDNGDVPAIEIYDDYRE